MSKSERAQLEMKISKYRQIARTSDPVTAERVTALVSELERKLAAGAIHCIRATQQTDSLSDATEQ